VLLSDLLAMKEIHITEENIGQWPKFKNLLETGKVVFDKRGVLRYRHGAPAGKLILVRVKNDGTPVYKESANEWFDPESNTARDFVWPE